MTSPEGDALASRSGAVSGRTGVLFYNLFALVVALGVYSSWWPGVFTRDSEDIQRQAMTGIVHDWHSPLLSRLWQLTATIDPGPALPYLIACLSTVLLAANLILRVSGSPLRSAICLVLFVLLPPVYVSLGLVTKDLFFCAATFAVFLGVASHAERPRNWKAVAILLTMLVATLFRRDAIFATLPVLAYLAYLPLKRRLGHAAIAACCAIFMSFAGTLALFFGSEVTNRVVFRAEAKFPAQVLLIYDLAAISLLDGKNLIPKDWLPPEGLQLSSIRARFDPGDGMPLFWSVGAPNVRLRPRSAQEELLEAWAMTVLDHPLLYVRVRLEYAAHFLGLRGAPPKLLGQFQGDGTMVRRLPHLGWALANSPLQRLYLTMSRTRWGRVAFVPWIWLLAGLACCWLWYRIADDGTTARGATVLPLLLATSAITYTAGMILVSMSALGRYHAWPRVSLGLVIALSVSVATLRLLDRQRQFARPTSPR